MASKLPSKHVSDARGIPCSCEWQVKLLLISGICLITISFLAGYFWGVSASLDQISTALDQEAFSDQISASLMPMQEPEDGQEHDQEEESVLENSTDVQSSIEEQSQQVCADRTYYAQLAGFGNKEFAYRFAQKLIKRKIPVIVNAVHSKTNRGKSITWYQVVTESYSTKEELVALVEQLKETEKLKDPQIVHC